MNNVCGVVAIMSFDPPDIRAHVERLVKRFEQLNDMTVRVIVADDLRGLPLVNPRFARYYAWQLVPKSIERIIYFDTDVLPLWPLPKLPEDAFAAVEENSSCAEAAKRQVPLLKRVSSYFSTGFFVADRRTEELFKRVLARQTTATEGKQPLLWDQTLVNVEVHTAVIMEEFSYKALPLDWCCQYWDLSPEQTTCMVHFPGVGPLKIRMLSHMAGVIDSTMHGESKR